MNKKEIKNKLRQEICVVTFTKKNGDKRVMRSTLDLSLIPEDLHPKGTGNPVPSHLVVAYDLDAEGWRSFDSSSVITLEAV